MRISDWSSDVCSSDLHADDAKEQAAGEVDGAVDARAGGARPGDGKAGKHRCDQHLEQVPPARAPRKLPGMMASSWATTLSSWARATLLETAAASRVVGSISNPFPGRTISPTKSPMASATVDTTSK